mgnify:CR=1 FL=1
MSLIPAFIRERPALAAFALLATAGSGFGQTFLISIFGTLLRDSFALSHAVYGALYSGATVCSALLLLRLGTLADSWPLSRLITLAVSILALGCLAIGLAPHAAVLTLGFFLIRLGGQGLMSHIGLTTAGRYFHQHRGKVIALSGSGFALAEATLPITAVTLIGLIGWRGSWLAGAALLILVLLPLYRWLVKDAPPPEMAQADTVEASHGWRRDQVLRDAGFYLLLPAAIITPFVVTAILFHQGAIANARGWPLALVAGGFAGYAAGHLFALLISGLLVDRLTARRTLPMSLLPMTGAMLLLANDSAHWVPLAYLTLTGMSQGAMSTAAGSLWPERYGTRHLGAIRSLAQAVMIVATAIAPLLTGMLLDAGISISILAVAMAILTLSCLILATLAPSVTTQQTI